MASCHCDPQKGEAISFGFQNKTAARRLPLAEEGREMKSIYANAVIMFALLAAVLVVIGCGDSDISTSANSRDSDKPLPPKNKESAENPNTLFYVEYGFLSANARQAIEKCLDADCAYNAVSNDPASNSQVIKKTDTKSNIIIWMKEIGMTDTDITAFWERVERNGKSLGTSYDNSRYYFASTSLSFSSSSIASSTDILFYVEYGFLSANARQAIEKCLDADCAYNAVSNDPASNSQVIKKTDTKSNIIIWMKEIGMTDTDITAFWERVERNGKSLGTSYDNSRYYFASTSLSFSSSSVVTTNLSTSSSSVAMSNSSISSSSVTTSTNISYGQLIDERDGQVYKTIEINGKTWMAENLNYKVEDSWCYDDLEENCQKYGRLYTATAAKNGESGYDCGANNACRNYDCKDASTVRGVCPPNWHLPAFNEDVTSLYLTTKKNGNECNLNVFDNLLARKLKSTSWDGTDDYGFSLLPSGYRNSGIPASFTGIGSAAGFWTSTTGYINGDTHNYIYTFKTSRDNMYSGEVDKDASSAYSVRCIKD